MRRIDRVLQMLAAAVEDADMVVLPELWISGAFDLPVARSVRSPLESATLDRVREIAERTGTWIHAGSYSEAGLSDETYNTAVLIDDRGDIAATYRKRHLFGFADGERTLMSAGSDLAVLPTPLGMTALATCYDLRFPEMFRALVDRGATAFLVCAGWPTPRISAWQVLCRARAIENLAWMVACNGVGAHAGIVLGGRSVIVDPRGDVVAEAGTDEEILLGQVEPGAAAEWRTAFPALEDRMPDADPRF